MTDLFAMSKGPDSYITEFLIEFKSIVGYVSRTSNPDNLLEVLVKQADEIGKIFIEPGYKAYSDILKNDKGEINLLANELLMSYIITHYFSESFKFFMILWRDSIFEIQKARLFILDDIRNLAVQEKLFHETKSTLLNASEDLLTDINNQVKKATENSKLYKKHVKLWNLQKNPWHSYQNQISEIIRQCHTLHEKHLIIYKSALSFQRIKLEVFEIVKYCKKELEEINQVVNTITEFILDEAQNPTPKSLTLIANKLQTIEAQVLLTHHIDLFNSKLENELINIDGDTEFTIQIENGLLTLIKINFKRRLTLWLNREILPLLFEVWEITELNKNGLKMALQNIRNMAILNSSELHDHKIQTFNSQTYILPLNVLVENSQDASRQVDNFANLLSNRISIDLKISLVYDPVQYFLPFTSGTAISNRLNLGKVKLLKVSQSWINTQFNQLQSFRKKMVHEFTLSRSEKMVRFLQKRKRDESNSNYTSFFTTKGYFGDLFAIGREEELNHISLLINNWKDGFRGSAIITGQRFSGKTLIGELVASKNFHENTIRLSPGITLSLHGRKMEASYNLMESLEFIAKNNQHTKYMIWIDDIELWWEPNIPLYRNINELSSFIDHNSINFFFLVSMNLSTFHHLSQVIELERIFQTHIHLGKLSANEIEKAIRIRHNATHYMLMNTKDEKIRPAEFRKISKEITQLSNGNIGDALNLWSYFTKKIDEDKVLLMAIPTVKIPDFYRSDLAVLFTSIILQKRTNEYRLRKLFGPTFSEHYKPVLSRMISIGVIQRQTDGWLEINEKVVNALGTMLSEKHYLNY